MARIVDDSLLLFSETLSESHLESLHRHIGDEEFANVKVSQNAYILLGNLQFYIIDNSSSGGPMPLEQN